MMRPHGTEGARIFSAGTVNRTMTRCGRRCAAFVVACLIILGTLATSLFATEKHAVAFERDVPVKMRDGVTLYADIYRPDADGKFPVLLERTPYNKKDSTGFGLKAVPHGYVVIVQDVRGRYASEGEWYPFKHESEDGYDTVEWAAALPYSSGKVGMFGGSYVGATQLLAAIARPPHLTGIFPIMTASDYHDGWTYQGGAFEQWFNESWTSILACDTMERRGEKNNVVPWLSKLPLTNYPILELGTGQSLAPYFFDWLQHPLYDDYWKPWAIADHFSQIQVPAYHLGGWYDIFLGGTLRNYAGLKAQGASEGVRRGQRLIVGPWRHVSLDSKAGDLDFGDSARVDDDELLLRWYDALLKGAENGIEKEKPVRIFVMGKNEWRDEDDWPLARARDTRFYLRSGGKANTSSGDGVLSTTPPQAEASDRFTYDPSDPVPTRGGGLCCDAFDAHMDPGVFDQRPVESRNDVLVYTTPPLREDMEVTGPIRVELYTSSSAVDTDFTAKLVDVYPSGLVQNLTDGILRVRYRNSQEKSELMKPGQIYKLAIDVWATSNAFLAGHRVRLEVSSSNFPRFNRNLNTGEDPERGTCWVKADNLIYHDRNHPSALILPVVAKQPADR
jgi:putative CocE/NonD family hydrolase